MTIGIVLPLEDGVLLVADGRETYPHDPARSPTDNSNKIERITPTVGTISFGLIQATENAVITLRQSLTASPIYTPQQVHQSVLSSVRFGWNLLFAERWKDAGEKRYDPTSRAALIVGGLAGTVPFASALLIYADRATGGNTEDSALVLNPYIPIILCDEGERARDDFQARVAQVRAMYGTNPGDGLKNRIVMNLLDAASATISMIAARDMTKSVGGTNHYALIRRGHPYTMGHQIGVRAWT
jgi:hypothetical protein